MSKTSLISDMGATVQAQLACYEYCSEASRRSRGSARDDLEVFRSASVSLHQHSELDLIPAFWEVLRESKNISVRLSLFIVRVL